MADNRPNILLILTDQQRFDIMSNTGNRIGARTPAMDALAREGVLFNNAFCTSPICGPSRATIMTGMFPSQAGVHANLGPAQPLSPAKITIGNRMQSIGYETAYHGKWHLGGDMHEFGWELAQESGHDANALHDATAFYRRDWFAHKRPFFQVASFLNPHDLYFFDPLDRSGPPGEPWVGQTDPLTNKPLPQQQNSRRDWSQEKWGAYRRFYAQCLERADAHVGELMHQLTCSGFAHNTWVIFASDHGDSAGENGLAFKGPWMYDGVLRVPLIVVPPRTRFTGKGKGSTGDECFRGRTCDELVSLIDLVPTILDLSGAPADASLPGRSLVPHLTEKPTGAKGHEAIFAEWHQYGAFVSPIRTVRTRGWKYNHYLGFGEELYDMDADPKELTNLAGVPAHASVQSDLKRTLDAHIERTNDPFYSHKPTLLDKTSPKSGSLVES